MMDDCLFCRCCGVSCVTEIPEHKKDHDINKTNNNLSSYQNSLNTTMTTTSTKQTIIFHPNSLSSGSSVKMIDDCSFCRCRGVSCVQGFLLR
jgi:hypothetical protein